MYLLLWMSLKEAVRLEAKHPRLRLGQYRMFLATSNSRKMGNWIELRDSYSRHPISCLLGRVMSKKSSLDS